MESILDKLAKLSIKKPLSCKNSVLTKDDEQVLPPASTWKTEVLSLLVSISRAKGDYFVYSDDIKEFEEVLKKRRNSVGKTVLATSRRALQELRNIGVVTFVDNKGTYRVSGDMDAVLDVMKPKKGRSSGERTVERILRTEKLEFNIEHKFDDLRGKSKSYLRFDFYLEIKGSRVCIEFDGKQHFESVEFFGGETAYIQGKIRDLTKNKYCEDNNIVLIRIPYTEKNVKKFLLEKLKEMTGYKR